jgi:hypothetical protein
MSKELDEKFVADHTGGTVVPPAEAAEPTNAAGGAIQKKRADVKKSVDPKAASVPAMVAGQAGGGKLTKEEAEVEDDAEEIVEIDESIESIFEGMDLSEEFKNKVTLVFEAAVNEAATKKAEAIIAETTEALEEEMNKTIEESVDGIIENLDSYLDYVVKEWMEENQVAIEAGIKVEMAESLMDGLKNLFNEHNIEIDEDTIDVVAGLEEELEETKEAANAAINENVALAKEIASLKAERVFEEMTEDLTITQRERLKVLSEKLSVENLEEYSSDLETLKESFFSKKKAVTEEVAEEEEIITEETAPKKPVSDHFTVNALVEALNARSSAKK